MMIQVDMRLMAALVASRGGKITVNMHDVARMDPRAEVMIIMEPRGTAMTFELKLPMDSGALDAQFKVVA